MILLMGQMKIEKNEKIVDFWNPQCYYITRAADKAAMDFLK